MVGMAPAGACIGGSGTRAVRRNALVPACKHWLVVAVVVLSAAGTVFASSASASAASQEPSASINKVQTWLEELGVEQTVATEQAETYTTAHDVMALYTSSTHMCTGLRHAPAHSSSFDC